MTALTGEPLGHLNQDDSMAANPTTTNRTNGFHDSNPFRQRQCPRDWGARPQLPRGPAKLRVDSGSGGSERSGRAAAERR